MPSKKRVIQKHRDAVTHHQKVIGFLAQLELGKTYVIKGTSHVYGDDGWETRKNVDIGVVRTFNETSVRVQLIASTSRELRGHPYHKVKHPDYAALKYECIEDIKPISEEKLLEEVPLYAGGEGFPLMKKLLETGRL